MLSIVNNVWADFILYYVILIVKVTIKSLIL